MPKIGLLVQGGGSRGSYTALPLDLLMKEGIWADEVIGTSMGSLMACNYVSRDIGRAAKLTLILSKDEHFFNPLAILRKGTMFNYDYLLNKLPKKALPFNQERFQLNPCKFYVVASNCLTGRTAYFSKDDSEFAKALQASAALPLTTREVFVHGVPYLDGGITTPIAIEKMLADGYAKIIVLATQQKGYRKEPLKKNRIAMIHRMYKDYPAWLEVYDRSVEVYNAQMDLIDKLAAEGRIFVLYPSKAPNVSHSEQSHRKLNALISLGGRDALAALPDLKAYLSK
jgi:predicted patatin/cPLA2 family phospholipase